MKKLVKKLFPNYNKSVSRISLNNILKKQFNKLKPGIVLDIGAKHCPYKNLIPKTRYLTLDIDKRNSPDICSDLHNIKWQPNYFDTVIATEVLEHSYNPQKAINEIYRILKKGGACILSTRFIFPYHPDPQDYYRFTWDSLEYLFKKFENVKIYPQGNRIQIIWHAISDCGKIGLPFRILLNPLIAKIDYTDKRYPFGFVVCAKK